MFVSVKAELIDMSYFDEWENVRARLSGGRDKPTMWSECRFNSVVDRGSTCGEERYLMCGEDATALVGPSGDLTVEVLASKYITQPCDDDVALSALVTVECDSSSAVTCPPSELLGATDSRHCRDESSFFPPSPPPPPPSPPPPPPPPEVNVLEREALLAFKQSTARNRESLADWERNKPTCTWHGVTCSSDGRVTEL